MRRWAMKLVNGRGIAFVSAASRAAVKSGTMTGRTGSIFSARDFLQAVRIERAMTLVDLDSESEQEGNHGDFHDNIGQH